MADDTSTPVPTTPTPEVNQVPGVDYPWSANSEVVGASAQAYQDGNQAFRQQLLRQTAGDQDTTETMRKSFGAFNMMSMAVISQQMNGTDPVLAANTLAYNAIARQPFVGTIDDRAPVKPAGT